jgi:hypothetical protein
VKTLNPQILDVIDSAATESAVIRNTLLRGGFGFCSAHPQLKLRAIFNRRVAAWNFPPLLCTQME